MLPPRGGSYGGGGRSGGALGGYRAALGGASARFWGSSPGVESARTPLRASVEASGAKEHHLVALALLEQGRAARAEKAPKVAAISRKRYLLLRKKTLGPEHLDVIEPLDDLSSTYVELGKHGAAEGAYVKMGKVFAKHYAPDDPQGRA